MSLRARILLLVLLATLAPAAVFGLYFINERGRDIEAAKLDVAVMAKSAIDNLDDKVKGTVQLLHGLSRARDIETTDKAACSEFLAGVLARFPQYTGLLTITPDGELHCDSLLTGRKLNLSQRAYFKESSATLKPSFDFVIGGLTGIAVLQVAYPVLDQRGELRYILLASLNLSEYAQGVVASSTYPGLSMLVWNQKGVLLVSKPDTAGGTAAIGKDASTSDLFLFASSGKTATTILMPGPSGVDRFWASGTMAQSHGGGRLVVGISQDTLVANANRTLRNALLFLVAVSLVAFAFAWYVAETGIRRQVQLIANVARRVGWGDFDARSGPPYPRGELGELMAIVDGTAEAVQRQQTVIVSRSRDLQRVNRVLRVLSDINTLIVRVRDRDELFREACRIAVEVGGLRMAMIAIVDEKEITAVPMASAGMDGEFLAALRDRLSSPDTATSTNVARAIREKRMVVSNTSQRGADFALVERHVNAGIFSIAVLPLLIADEAVGVFTLYASEADYFDEEELKLLDEVAGDIAFAMDHIDKQERLDYLAYYDALTGLANRNLFLERLTQFMRAAAGGGDKLALLVVDLERFKNINDSLGRLAGDALLRQVALWLTNEVGDANQLARLGSDHFAIVLPDLKRTGDVVRLVEKSMEAIKEHPFQIEGAAFRIAVKAGVALFPDDGTDADSLFRHAESALRKAKASGDRYLFYAQKMTESVAGNLTMENQLRQALDKEEFVLHYQPKVALANGHVCGAEALIRWNDPRTGLVPPMQFIPLLEETGLIHDVGRWALRKAIEDYLRWRAAGLPAVRIAVNVSPLQLRDRNFVAEIEKVIGVDAHAAQGLELEITESVFMEDMERNIATLQAIRAMGVTVAIDDFGTGYSSLRYLAKLPVDTLKIDRSFVIEMTTDPQGLALVTTIISLAHALRLKVVAEGVDTDEQSRLLRLVSCDQFQGFLFSRAVPAEEFAQRFLHAPAAGVSRVPELQI